MQDLWKEAALPVTMQRIVDGIESLRLEGFPVAVAPSMRPSGIPRAHSWWFQSAFIAHVERC